MNEELRAKHHKEQAMILVWLAVAVGILAMVESVTVRVTNLE